jgi:divalent metal cation (Fe/Co/Zn/Cd) transporter
MSYLGIALTATSAAFMPVFGVAKRRIGARLNSAATRGEGMQNILCAYLSVAVLAGLLLNAAFGWWWADPLAALVIAFVAVREGIEAWEGEDCSH